MMGSSVEGATTTARRGVAVPSLRKAVAILDLIGRRGSQTFSAIQRSLDLPKSTTHQLIKALVDVGALHGLHDGGYVLGAKLSELGALAMDQRLIDRVALRHLETLANASGLYSVITTLEGCHAVGLAAALPSESATLAGCNGARLSLNHSAVGKALLAHLDDNDGTRLMSDIDWTQATATSIADIESMLRELDEVRRRGWALDDCEAREDQRCIAAPVFDGRNRVVAAIAAVGRPEEITPDSYARLSELVIGAAQGVMQDYRAL